MTNIKRLYRFGRAMITAWLAGIAIVMPLFIYVLKNQGFRLSASHKDILSAPLAPTRIYLDSLNTFTLIPEATYTPREGCCTDTIRLFTKPQFIKKIRMGKSPLEACLVINHRGRRQTKQILRVLKGVALPPDCQRVALFSRGYIPLSNPRTQTPRYGGGVHWVHRLIQNNILEDATWVTFDYDDIRANLGQEQDVAHFSAVVEAINTICPQAKICVLGDCRGAHVALRYLTEHDNPSIDTLVLESPYGSSGLMLDTVVKSYVAPYLGSYARPLFNRFFSWSHPLYDPAKDTLLDHIQTIKGRRIFIGHHLHDRVISDQNVLSLVENLRSNNDVYLFATASKEGDHSRLSLIPSYQRAVNAFLKTCNLPHHPTLAQQGMAFLEKAKHNGR